jgi:carbohydrate-selective porin OprB
MRYRFQKVKRVIATAGALVLLGAAPALAHEDDPDDPAGHQASVMHLAGEHPVTFGAGITMVAQGTDGPDAATDGSTYSVDIALETEVGDGGTAFIYLIGAQGTGADVGSEAGVNGDDESGDISEGGFSDTRVAEAWVHFPFADLGAITVGKIDPTGIYDGNELANDETAQFLNDNFVNNMAIAFPGYVAGLSVDLEPVEMLTFHLGAFEAADDFDGSFDSGFLIGEADLEGNLMDREGHARLMYWATPSASNEDNKGLAISLDQAVADAVSLFARWGTQEDTQAFDNAISLGGRVTVGDGEAGLAFATLSATAAGADDESTVEAYYKHPVTDNLVLTADVQLIQTPGFDPNADDATVFGLRAQADL